MDNDVTFQYPLDGWGPEWETPGDRLEWRARRFYAEGRLVDVVDHILRLMDEMVDEVQGWGSKTLEGFPGGLTAWVDPSNEGGARPLIIKLKVSSLD